MPELPEVETIRMGLEKYLVGHKIVGVEVRLRRIVAGDVKDIIGVKVLGVRRAGKGLIIDLDNDYSIAIHIKLTGQLIYRGLRVSRVPRVSREKVRTLPNKSTHVIFHLDRGGVLYYNDFRQFGWIKIVKTSEVEKLPFFKELGPEFMRDLTLDKFKEILSKSASPVKVVLMDQKKISGIGNIYANDGLNLAKIDPRKKAKELNSGEIKKLYDSLLEVLKTGLKYGGASELSYVNVLGEEGGYQNHFLTYGREGEKCFNCEATIKKIKIGGRGTYFCAKCQK